MEEDIIQWQIDRDSEERWWEEKLTAPAGGATRAVCAGGGSREVRRCGPESALVADREDF